MNPIAISSTLRAYRASLPKRTGRPNLTAVDLTGRTFGRWTVLGCCLRLASKPSKWLCKCACGEEAVISYVSLVMGKSKSCGCLRRELAVERQSRTSLRHEWKGELRTTQEISRMEGVSYATMMLKCEAGDMEIAQGIAYCREQELEFRETPRACWKRKQK